MTKSSGSVLFLHKIAQIRLNLGLTDFTICSSSCFPPGVYNTLLPSTETFHIKPLLTNLSSHKSNTVGIYLYIYV